MRDARRDRIAFCREIGWTRFGSRRWRVRRRRWSSFCFYWQNICRGHQLKKVEADQVPFVFDVSRRIEKSLSCFCAQTLGTWNIFRNFDSKSHVSKSSEFGVVGQVRRMHENKHIMNDIQLRCSGFTTRPAADVFLVRENRSQWTSCMIKQIRVSARACLYSFSTKE